MFQAISKFILKILGWKIQGHYPDDIKKKILIAAPHTSNWDFIIGILVRTAMGRDIKYIGKPSLFKPPLSWIMYPLGGIPVDVDPNRSFVENVANMFNKTDELSIVIAPEGQRKKANKFKTGFYYIAKMANIPILPTVFDFKNKSVRFLDLVYPEWTGQEEIDNIEKLFKGIVGFYQKDSFN